MGLKDNMEVIEEIKNWFELAIPNPTTDNQRVQAGVHAEEFCEMLETMQIEYSEVDRVSLKPEIAHNYLSSLADTLKKNKSIDLAITDRKELLDSLCDQIVTATGVAHMYGFDIVGALKEVSRSNTSKFVDGKPVFNESGKIAKGSNYSPPNLESFLGQDPTK
jgi:predicted HAD superfamily Cof-like phosphohydrolase